jgi:hypothetical protein
MRWKLGDLKADCGPNTDAKGMLDLLSGFGGGM